MIYPDWRMYKPKKTGDGAATQINMRDAFKKNAKPPYNKTMQLFFTGANQKGFEGDNASFDWENPVIMKLGLPDIGELLATLKGFKDHVGTDAKKGLYHQNPNGNTVLCFSVWNDLYALKLSSQRDGQTKIVKHVVTKGEAQILQAYLDAFLAMFFSPHQ